MAAALHLRLTASALILAGFAVPADGQEVPPLRQRALPLVVEVQGVWRDQDKWTDFCKGSQSDPITNDPAAAADKLPCISKGSGIVLGYDSKVIYVATAAHVLLPDEDSKQPDEVRVSFRRPRRSRRDYPADIVSRDEKQALFKTNTLDLAVLAVRGIPEDELREIRRSVPFRRLRREPLEGDGMPLWPLGFPVSTNGSRWTFEPGDLLVEERLRPAVRYIGLEEGYSGGGIFTEEGELVGLTWGGSQAQVEMTPIDSVIAVAQHWGAQVRLSRPAVPPRGYRYSFGVSGSLGTDPWFDHEYYYGRTSRSWGTRAEVMFHTRSRAYITVSYQWLIGDDARVRAPFAGVGIDATRFGNPDRYGGLYTVTLSPFVEASPRADVYTVRDAGGYISTPPGAEPDGGEYTPSLVSAHYRTWGLTLGMRLESVVAPRVVAGLLLGQSGFWYRGDFDGITRTTAAFQFRYALP